jgi:multisubunit Na+/H+ antiporter MnhF subunit
MVLAFTAAAVAMLICLIPAWIVVARGDLAEAVVAYEFITAVIVMVLALLAQAFQRSSLFELPVLLALREHGGDLPGPVLHGDRRPVPVARDHARHPGPGEGGLASDAARTPETANTAPQEEREQ